MESLANQFGNAVRTIDLHDLFANRAVKLVVINLLEGFTVFLVTRNLADENHHRGRILHRRVYAD